MYVFYFVLTETRSILIQTSGFGKNEFWIHWPVIDGNQVCQIWSITIISS